MRIFAYTGTTFSTAMTTAFESGLQEAGWPKTIDGAGHTAMVNYGNASADYTRLDNDITAGDAGNDMTVAFGGLKPAQSANNNCTKPFLILIGQIPRNFFFQNDGFCGGVNLDTPGKNVARHDLLIEHYGVKPDKVCLIWNKTGHMGKQEQKEWAKRNWIDIPVPQNNLGAITQAFTDAKGRGATAIVLSADPFFTSAMSTVVAAANDVTTRTLYVCYPFSDYMNSTPKPTPKYTMIYGPDLQFAYRLVGRKAGAILDALAAGIQAPDAGLSPGILTDPIFVGGDPTFALSVSDGAGAKADAKDLDENDEE
jgi:hypothetical protein